MHERLREPTFHHTIVVISTMSNGAESAGRLTAGMVRAAVARAASRPESAVELVDFSGEEGAAKGESYTTVMRAVTARARVAGEEETHHFMVKEVPANQGRHSVDCRENS